MQTSNPKPRARFWARARVADALRARDAQRVTTPIVRSLFGAASVSAAPAAASITGRVRVAAHPRGALVALPPSDRGAMEVQALSPIRITQILVELEDFNGDSGASQRSLRSCGPWQPGAQVS